MLGLFFLSLFGIFLVSLGYPLLLLAIARLRPQPHNVDDDPTPYVTLIVACHNPGVLLQRKIDNSLALDYPADRLSMLIVSDGSNDGTAELLQRLESDRVQGIALQRHNGKAAALNAAIRRVSSNPITEILVFTDVDAQLSADALRKLMRHFADPHIGGVCGQRVVAQNRAQFHEAQASYVGWDSRIKALETRVGSITSNDGKLYAIRREATAPIADGTTDDLYMALNAISQGWRFIFDGEARAFVPPPAKSPQHEIPRRRRIVARSLRGIYRMQAVLNPLRHGFYSIALLTNKVLRRCLPIMFALLLLSNLWLAFFSPIFAALLAGQLAFCGLAGIGARYTTRTSLLGRTAYRANYIALGLAGTWLGVWDFLRGRIVNAWEPIKDTNATRGFNRHASTLPSKESHRKY